MQFSYHTELVMTMATVQSQIFMSYRNMFCIRLCLFRMRLFMFSFLCYYVDISVPLMFVSWRSEVKGGHIFTLTTPHNYAILPTK